MEVILTIIAIIIALIIDYLLATEFYFAANAKGYYERKYLWICFVFGVIGYLLVIALPDRGNSKPAAATSSQQPLQMGYQEAPKPQAEQPMSSGGWRCSCGRANASYVSTCACGKSRRDVEQSLKNGGWKCTCGRANANYVSTCACGKSKRDVMVK